MKKFTLLMAFFAMTFSGIAQNPFQDGMIFNGSSIVCAGDAEGNCDPDNSNIPLTNQITVFLGDNPDEIVISDITGGLYVQGYGASSGIPATVIVDDANQTLTVTDAPDVVFPGDMFNATGTYTTDGDGNVTSFDLAWSNNHGDAGTTDFTFDSMLDITAPGAASNPTPADGATDVDIVYAETGETAINFAWDAPATGDAPDNYTIRIGTTPALDGDDTISGTFASNVIDGLYLPDNDFFEVNTTYYWQVIPNNMAGSADNVPTWSFTTEATSSVEEVVANEFSHYYNVNSKMLEINAENAIDNVTVYSILGQEVLNTKMNTTNASVDVSSLNNGVYLAKVAVNGKTKTIKFVKN